MLLKIEYDIRNKRDTEAWDKAKSCRKTMTNCSRWLKEPTNKFAYTTLQQCTYEN